MDCCLLKVRDDFLENIECGVDGVVLRCGDLVASSLTTTTSSSSLLLLLFLKLSVLL